jgi:hypothetical protein
MTGSRLFTIAATTLASTLLLAQAADGATIRRHINCVAYAGVVLPLVNQPALGAVEISNNWSFAIPAGTVYTYTYAGRQKSYRSPSALAPGAKLSIGDDAVTTTQACDATYPDAGFGLGKNLQNIPNVTLQKSP